MKNKSVPIYLTQQQYNAVREASVRYGRPMTAVIRDLIQKELVENSPPPTDLSDMVGILHVGHPTNMARDHDRILEEELLNDLRRHQRPPGAPDTERPIPSGRKKSRG